MKLRTVSVTCPACRGALPDAPVVAATRVSGPVTLTVSLALDLSDTWWARARLTHPRCFGGRDDHPQEAAA